MSRNWWMSLLPHALSLLTVLLPAASAQPTGQRPNVVLIISDDQAWTDYGFMGHKVIRTPNLDQLARQSAVFLRGYVPTALCRPSLASIITGLYPHQHKITGNDPAVPEGTDRRALGSSAVYQRLRQQVIDHIDHVPTLPRLLDERGYVSYQSGKWWEGNYRRGGFTAGMTHGDPRRGGRHGDEGLKIGRTGMQPIFDFLQQARGRPFFLWYAPFLPHAPHNPPARLLDQYTAPSRPVALARYYAMCQWLDETCGQLLDYLDEKGLSDNTLVIYLADNGWIQRTRDQTVPAGWRGSFAPKSKQSPYDGGVRTPILLRWPGKIKPARYDAPVSSIDLAPTILAACGMHATEQMPGINLLDLCRGRPAGRDAIFGEGFAHDIADIQDPEQSLLYRWCINGRWKLILTYGGKLGRYRAIHPRADRSPQLYDLHADPLETRNLAAQHPDVVKRLKGRIDRWWPLRHAPPRRAPASETAPAAASAASLTIPALRLAIEDLIRTFGPRYPKGDEYLRRLAELESRQAKADDPGSDDARPLRDDLAALEREALLANPLLDFDQLVVLRRNFGPAARKVISSSLGMPTLNARTNDTIRPTGWDNEIAILSHLRAGGKLQTLYKPEGGKILTDLEVSFDATRVMFSSIGEAQSNWRIFQIGIDGRGLRQLTPDDGEDVGHFDSCYLPDGKILFASTACYQGLPCEFGSRKMAALYRLDPETQQIRRLTFDQDSDWCPAVLNNGRVLYLRWEYADLPHANSRLLFHMNPDGTGQREYYGSGSYFAPSLFFARPIPGHPTKVVAVAGGHHGISRSGRLLILDPARGRREADGVVQEIPGRGKKVEPIVRDRLIDGVWPQFLHPYPLSEKYFLVSMKWGPRSLWGIYLVDVFDNITLVKEVEGAALLDPIPLKARPTPPVIADRVDLASKQATVHLVDIYRGPGLAGIPRGTVKRLRLVSYYFSPRGCGGLLGSIGMDGPWDIKRVLGTIPVEPDGSARFTIPANTPISIQPLDGEGKALQLMRSWLVGMPGEHLSCVGCHAGQNATVPAGRTLASQRPPSSIRPWYGPVRGFAFHREVQPVLDRYCVACHDGRKRQGAAPLPDLRGDRHVTDWRSQIAGNCGHKLPGGGRFSVAYAQLHRYVRRPGIESDLHMLTPGEFHADTTELVQMLCKGHYGVRLDEQAWDRLITWIDLNAPYHGTWSEIVGQEKIAAVARRRRELSRRYDGTDVDYEAIWTPSRRTGPTPFLRSAFRHSPAEELRPRDRPSRPADPPAARRRPPSVGPRARRSIDLGGGVTLPLVLLPAGTFLMGSDRGHPDQRPPTLVAIREPFWMGQFEVTNEQFGRFDPAHDSRHESRHGYQFGRLGYPVNGPRQPVVRVSWNQAMAFCDWLSQLTGQRFTLPTEAQWEYACRAGTTTPMFYGDLDSDFSPWANLGDARLREFAADTAKGHYTRAELIRNPNQYDDWVPKDDRFDDGAFVSVDVGRYRANPWGLYDMHGNVWEWTRSALRPYPYRADDGRNDRSAPGRRVVRGGSWYDRPKRCTASFRLSYQPYHRVFNVGFRVVCQANPPGAAEKGEKPEQK